MNKILFVASLYHPHVGGIETMITELSKFYRKQGITPIVLTKKWPATLQEHESINGVKIYRVISAKKEEEFYSLINWLKDNEFKIKADIVHIIGVRRPLPLIGLILGKVWGSPVITTIAGGDIPDNYDPLPSVIWEEGKELIPDTIKQSDVVNCVSESLCRDLKKILPDIKDLGTLYAGIDLTIINEVKAEKIKDQFIISLRRLDPSKGVDLLIKAFNIIKERFPELHLVIAGEGLEEEKLKSIVRQYKLNDRVTFLGTVNLRRGIALLKGSVATVVPSLSEGGGLVNVEAQAAGVPVIASRVGGIPEYLADNESGILFESGNYKELAEKISQVISDKKLREKIIEGGYKHSKLFDWNVLAPKYIELYLKSINEYNKNSVFRPWSGLTLNLWNKLINQ